MAKIVHYVIILCLILLDGNGIQAASHQSGLDISAMIRRTMWRHPFLSTENQRRSLSNVNSFQDLSWRMRRNLAQNESSNTTKGEPGDDYCATNYLSLDVLYFIAGFEHFDTALMCLSVIATIASIILLSSLIMTDTRIIHINYLVALTFYFSWAIIFLWNWVPETENVAFCGSIIFIGHYLAIAVFMWMLLEGVQILLTFISVFSANSDQCGKRLSIMIVLGWGCPAVISSSCVLTNNDTYIFKFEEYEYALCWFDTTNSWLLYGPVIAITGINFVIAIVVLIILEKNRNPRLLTKAKDDSGDIRQRIRSFLVLCPLLGIPWLITVISWFVQCQNATLYIILLLLSITINSLQGVFFFLAHCILNRKVRDAIKKRFFRYKSKRSTSTSRTLPTSPETLRRHLSRIKRETLTKYETKFESIDGLTRTPSTGSNFIARTHSSGNSQNSNHAKPLDEKKSPTSITIITTAI